MGELRRSDIFFPGNISPRMGLICCDYFLLPILGPDGAKKTSMKSEERCFVTQHYYSQRGAEKFVLEPKPVFQK